MLSRTISHSASTCSKASGKAGQKLHIRRTVSFFERENMEGLMEGGREEKKKGRKQGIKEGMSREQAWVIKVKHNLF